MKFKLFTLVSSNLLLEDPYCAINSAGDRLLMISEDMIRFDIPTDPKELAELYHDYIPTSRTIEYDLTKLENLISIYTSQTNVGFAAHFKPGPRYIGLTFAKLPEYFNWHEYVDASHSDPEARNIVSEIYQNMQPLLKQVFINEPH